MRYSIFKIQEGGHHHCGIGVANVVVVVIKEKAMTGRRYEESCIVQMIRVKFKFVCLWLHFPRMTTGEVVEAIDGFHLSVRSGIRFQLGRNLYITCVLSHPSNSSQSSAWNTRSCDELNKHSHKPSTLSYQVLASSAYSQRLCTFGISYVRVHIHDDEFSYMDNQNLHSTKPNQHNQTQWSNSNHTQPLSPSLHLPFFLLQVFTPVHSNQILFRFCFSPENRSTYLSQTTNNHTLLTL